MNQIDLKFIGTVFDLKIELEGKEVGLYFDGASTWTRTLEEFKISGELDLVMMCKGVNGTQWSLEITINGTDPLTYAGEVKKGYSLLSDKIAIPSEN